MVALRKKGMKERHWKVISEAVGIEINPQEADFNFSKVLDLGLMKHIDVCVEIGEKAAKEFQIETMLNEMISQWSDMNFNLLLYKNITHIIKVLIFIIKFFFFNNFSYFRVTMIFKQY